MTETIEVEVSSIAAFAHEQLQQIDEYNDVFAESVEDFIIDAFREAEQQSNAQESDVESAIEEVEE